MPSTLARMLERESRQREREAQRAARRIEQETTPTQMWPADKQDRIVAIACILGGVLMLIAELTGRLA
jgi:hypothetical protein